MREHVFVNETMRGGYYVAAGIDLPGDLPNARKAINDLCMPGQGCIHFYPKATAAGDLDQVQAAEAFAEELAARRTPSIRTIRTMMHAGQPRPQQIPPVHTHSGS